MERWLKGKSLLVKRGRAPIFNLRVGKVKSPNFGIKSQFKGRKAYFGMPAQLFKDSDRDGVMNVFDCKPYNKRRQDVIAPGLGGGSPMQDLVQRKEQNREQKEYEKQMAIVKRQQEAADKAYRKAQSDAEKAQQDIEDQNEAWNLYRRGFLPQDARGSGAYKYLLKIYNENQGKLYSKVRDESFATRKDALAQAEKQQQEAQAKQKGTEKAEKEIAIRKANLDATYRRIEQAKQTAMNRYSGVQLASIISRLDSQQQQAIDTYNRETGDSVKISDFY